MTVAFGVMLCVVVVALLVERVRSQGIHERELRLLMNMIQADTVPEFIALERAMQAPKDPEAAKPVYHPIGA